MTTQFDLSEKLGKIEDLISAAGTPGERVAAEAASARLRAKLAKSARDEPSAEIEIALGDPWSQMLFVALCRRYGLAPYRHARQRQGTIVVRAPQRFVDEVLWRQFRSVDAALRTYFTEITLKLIRAEICADTSEVQEILEALPAA